ncbi:hypothetical protein HID58_030781 [Brassica napus]|uniref:Protein kinase domain-containing protein n=1 Tax=Brassica napus TaxID=3708 RepID=A0ABQ8CGZ7_BRANA|nr:hypothetical protein HID58_030781 [Brassica napus]
MGLYRIVSAVDGRNEIVPPAQSQIPNKVLSLCLFIVLLVNKVHSLLKLLVEVTESVSVLKTAAKTRKVAAEEILAAFSAIEKAKVDPSPFLETLGGSESPGRTWMLIFTAEKKLKKGRYFPLTAVQRFDAAGKRIENGVYLGPLGALTFEGKFSWKNRILAFIFEQIRIKIGPLDPIKIGLGKKDAEEEPSNKDPFFIWFYVDEEIAVARGRSGDTTNHQRLLYFSGEMAEMEQPKKVADRYLKQEVLGQGTYGVVFKATDTKTGETVAIKKIRIGKHKEGVNITALREIKMLKELKHPHIILLIDAFPHKQNLHLVFEFMETDLEGVIRDSNVFLSPADVKSYLLMTLKGLAYCHEKRVFARWYRAPELLFGAKQYGAAVDVWAAGCIFAELLLRRPFLQGNSDIDQLSKIFAAFGTPKADQWPDMKNLPDYVEYQFVPAPSLRSLFPTVSEDALDLLSKLFTYDPKARISVKQALEHRYFTSAPSPTDPAKLPKPVRKQEGKASYGKHEAIKVISPPRKIRRVMPERGRLDGMKFQVDKDQQAPMSLDFTILAERPPNRPTITSADRSHLKRKLDLDFQ